MSRFNALGLAVQERTLKDLWSVFVFASLGFVHMHGQCATYHS